MPVSDRVGYMTVLNQMYGALYDLNVEPDFVAAGDPAISRYKVLLVPPLYSASDAVLEAIADYVQRGGHVVMAFKSGFTNEYSTVRDTWRRDRCAPPRDFTTRSSRIWPNPCASRPIRTASGAENKGSVWQEFLIPDTAETYSHRSITRTGISRRSRAIAIGSGTLTYEATVVTDALQRGDRPRGACARRTHRTGPATARGRKGPARPQFSRQSTLHYYLNFSGQRRAVPVPLRLRRGSPDRHSGRERTGADAGGVGSGNRRGTVAYAHTHRPASPERRRPRGRDGPLPRRSAPDALAKCPAKNASIARDDARKAVVFTFDPVAGEPEIRMPVRALGWPSDWSEWRSIQYNFLASSVEPLSIAFDDGRIAKAFTDRAAPGHPHLRRDSVRFLRPDTLDESAAASRLQGLAEAPLHFPERRGGGVPHALSSADHTHRDRELHPAPRRPGGRHPRPQSR